MSSSITSYLSSLSIQIEDSSIAQVSKCQSQSSLFNQNLWSFNPTSPKMEET